MHDNLDVETWEHDPTPPALDSDKIHTVVDMAGINLMPLGIDISWPEPDDHAKLAISARSEVDPLRLHRGHQFHHRSTETRRWNRGVPVRTALAEFVDLPGGRDDSPEEGLESGQDSGCDQDQEENAEGGNMSEGCRR